MQHIQDSQLGTPNQKEEFGTQNIDCALQHHAEPGSKKAQKPSTVGT